MAVVKRFNVNEEQATLDADIIENMSANDVSYDDSFQYDKNTVGGKLSELEMEVKDIRVLQPIIKLKGYYVTTNGYRSDYSSFAIFEPIVVKSGDVVSVKLDAYNVACAPLSFNTDGNTNSDMLATVLAEYNELNEYNVIIQDDGYLILSGDKTKHPEVTIVRKYNFSQIEQNRQDIIKEVMRSENKEQELYTDILAVERVIGEPMNINIKVDTVLSGWYLDGSKTDGSYQYYSSLSSVFFSIEKDRTYNIHIPHATNNAAWILGISTANNRYTNASIITEAGKGNNDIFDYTLTSRIDGYLVVGIATDSEMPTLSYVDYKNGIIDDIKELKSNVSGTTYYDNVTLDTILSGWYLDGSKTDGSYQYYSSLSSVFFSIEKDRTYNIHIPHATNNAAWILGISTANNRYTNASIITEAGKGNNDIFDYTLTSRIDGYLVVGIATDSETPTLKVKRTTDCVETRLEDVEKEIEILNVSNPLFGKKIMFFGDSLVSNASSTLNVVGGFSRLIAERNGCAYKRYLDLIEPTDSDYSFIGIKNIGRDGTTLRTRVEDVYANSSVNERVHKWVKEGTCDLAVIQGGTNDYKTNFGVITDTYDGGYDTSTTLGALEDILYYVTGLGIKVCFLVMHKVSYISDDYYDMHKKVCEKWGVPYLDLTHSAGFYMSSSNRKHGEMYSIKPNEYDPNKTYDVDSKVTYLGKSYKSLTVVTGVAPTDSTKWTFVSDFPYDMCHLNDLGNEVVSYKIEQFIKSV